jgi:hypothetical protein
MTACKTCSLGAQALVNTLAAKLGMKVVVFKVTDKGKQQGSGQVRGLERTRQQYP